MKRTRNHTKCIERKKNCKSIKRSKTEKKNKITIIVIINQVQRVRDNPVKCVYSAQALKLN